MLIATTVSGGFGVLIYAALWFLMPLAPERVPGAPGLAAHTRSGMRTDEQPAPVTEAKQRKREKSRGQLPALVAIGIGLLILLQVAGFGSGRRLRLSGPGLRAPADFAVAGLPDDFVTQWHANRTQFPCGVDLILCAVAYTILVIQLRRLHGPDTAFARALGNDTKGKLSVVLYLAAVALAFPNRWVAVALYVVVAVMWFVPDRRFARIVPLTPPATPPTMKMPASGQSTSPEKA